MRMNCAMAGVWGMWATFMTILRSGSAGQYTRGLGMNILSVDTTTPWGSVALLRDGDVTGEVRLYEETGHSRALFLSIDHLTRAQGLAATDIDAFVAAIGPGSFTGVRVGVSAVQGL